WDDGLGHITLTLALSLRERELVCRALVRNVLDGWLWDDGLGHITLTPALSLRERELAWQANLRGVLVVISEVRVEEGDKLLQRFDDAWAGAGVKVRVQLVHAPVDDRAQGAPARARGHGG